MIEINGVYEKAYFDKSRYQIIYGGAGSGKSYFIAQKIIARVASEIPHRFLLIRKVHRTIKKSQFQLLKDIIYTNNLNDLFEFNNSEYSIICKKNGNEIISCGVDDVEKLKSIHGVTSIWIEEATELTQEDFQQINLRLRGETKNYKQIILSFNPISSLHWLNQIKLDNCFRLKTTYLDNKFIDEDYKRELESLKEQDLNFYNIYTLGEWGLLQNTIYRPFEIINDYPEEYEDRFYAIDFGFNNQTAIIEIGIKDMNYYTRELFYERKKTNQDIINFIESMKLKGFRFYCDSAEPQRIEELNRAGINAMASDKSVKDGIDFVKRCKIYSRSENENLNKEVLTYSYKKDKNGNILDEPVKFNDHALDALRYGIYTHSKSAKSEIFYV